MLPKKWIIDIPLSLKEREILFLTAEAAEIEVYHITRSHAQMEDFPYVIYDDDFRICGHSGRGFSVAYYEKVKYKKVMKELQKVIKEQINGHKQTMGD